MQFYDPDQVDIIVSGVPMSGFGPDTMAKFKSDSKRFKIVKGVKGDVTRSKILAKVGILTLTLMSSSRSNDILSLLHKTDISTPGGAGVVALLVRDRNGTSLLTSATVFVDEMPEIAFGSEAHPVDWSIMCVDYTDFLGGN